MRTYTEQWDSARGPMFYHSLRDCARLLTLKSVLAAGRGLVSLHVREFRTVTVAGGASARPRANAALRQHTSAALTINENFDSGKRLPPKASCPPPAAHWPLACCSETQTSGEVRDPVYFLPRPCAEDDRPIPTSAPLDMDMALDNIVPESLSWRHTDEGPE